MQTNFLLMNFMANKSTPCPEKRCHFIFDYNSRKSQQFNNFSLHVKINYIEYEDKFLIKTHENVTLSLMEWLMAMMVTCWHKAANLAQIDFGPKQNF